MRFGLVIALLSSIGFHQFDAFYLTVALDDAIRLRIFVMVPGCAILLALAFTSWSDRLYSPLAGLCLAIHCGVSYIYAQEGPSTVVLYLLITLQTYIFLFVLFRIPFSTAAGCGVAILSIFTYTIFLSDLPFTGSMSYLLACLMGASMLGAMSWSTQQDAKNLHRTLIELEDTQSSLIAEKESRIRDLSDMTRYLGHEIRGFLGIAQVSIPKNLDTKQGTRLQRSLDGISNVLKNTSDATSLAQTLAHSLEKEQKESQVGFATLIDTVIQRFPNAVFNCQLDRAINVDLNSTRMIQAINAVVENAVSFSDSGHPIEVTLTNVYGSIELLVSNRGPSPTLSAAELFEPFRTTRGLQTGGHSGIGLFVAKTVFAAHRGTIDFTHVDSISTFRIRIAADQST